MSVFDLARLAETEQQLFQGFEQLAVGECLELSAEQRPMRLQALFEKKYSQSYRWDYLQDGPDLWRWQIRKIRDEKVGAPCCGFCSGTH